MIQRNWKPYDPRWLVELARGQFPDEIWLQEALGQGTRCFKEPTVTYFVEYDAPGADWPFDRTLWLTGPRGNSVLVSILVGQPIRAVEELEFSR